MENSEKAKNTIEYLIATAIYQKELAIHAEAQLRYAKALQEYSIAFANYTNSVYIN